jgi:hypothetical protein
VEHVHATVARSAAQPRHARSVQVLDVLAGAR